MSNAKDAPDDFKRRNQQLAKELLEAMQRPGVDPERAAYEARKERADRARLEEYHRQIGAPTDDVPRARTTIEMVFAASLAPCPHCGSTEPAKLDFLRGDDWANLAGPCPRCGRPRSFTWKTEGNPFDGAHGVRELGDARPSQIIRPGQFLAELDRLLPRIQPEPERLQVAEWYDSVHALNRAITCLLELLKFVPPHLRVIPDTKLTDEERQDRAARRARYSGPWLTAERDRLFALLARYEADALRIDEIERQTEVEPTGAIDLDSLYAHDRWVRAGRTGPGRLEVVGYDARGARHSAREMTEAYLESVNFDRAVLEGAVLAQAELRDVSAIAAYMTSIILERATIERGTFARSMLPLADFRDAVIDETSFHEAYLDRSMWSGARVSAADFDGATFGNANLDGAHFVGCTFRSADFRPLSDRFPATTQAVFEDCDLRGSRWAGRDVAGASFVRCKLAGMSGRPRSVANVEIVAPDLSADGDGSDAAAPEDVLALWGWGGT